MQTQTSFKRLMLRAVLRKANPMAVRILAIPDHLSLADFDEVLRTVLGWKGLGFSFHIDGQEFISFLRKTRAHRTILQDFQLWPRETFLYACGGMDLWKREFRVLDSEAGRIGGETPVYLAGRGASPPEFCEGPTGCRPFLKRPQEGGSMGTPAHIEVAIAMLRAAHPDEPPRSWDILRDAMADSIRSIEQRLEVTEIQRRESAMETLGLSLVESKDLLQGV